VRGRARLLPETGDQECVPRLRSVAEEKPPSIGRLRKPHNREIAEVRDLLRFAAGKGTIVDRT
jgi:hypothetical protein